MERCGFRFKLETFGCQCFNSYREKRESCDGLKRKSDFNSYLWFGCLFGFHNVSSTFRRHLLQNYGESLLTAEDADTSSIHQSDVNGFSEIQYASPWKIKERIQLICYRGGS